MNILALKLAAAGLPLLLSGGAEALNLRIKEHNPEPYGEQLLPQELDSSQCSVVSIGFGDKVIASKATQNVFACRNFCSVTDKCKGYTFDFLKNACSLHETIDEPRVKGSETSGARNCLIEDSVNCVLVNKGYKDDTMKQMNNVKSMIECMKLCRKEPGCVGATYNFASKICHLKRTINEPYDYGNDISAPLSCFMETAGNSCTVLHFRAKPLKVLATKKELTYYDCVVGCRDSEQCTDVNYDFYTQTCEHINGRGQLEPKKGTVYVPISCHII